MPLKVFNRQALHRDVVMTALGAQVIPIDGKQLRDSYDRNQD